MRLFPEYKLKYLNALCRWTLIAGLVPLSIYVYQGFWNIFVLLSWLSGVSGLIIFLASFAVISKTSEEYPNKSQFEKQEELPRLLSKHLIVPLAKRSGVERVYAEKEQVFLDRCFLMGILGYLLATGHIGLTVLWGLYYLGNGITVGALQAFDETFIEEI